MMDLPAGVLSRRALSFVRAHGQRKPSNRAQRFAEQWIKQGLDRALVQQAIDYERRWGDLYLPPSVLYNGGPKYLGPDLLVGRWSDGGYIEAGPARFSVSYDFLLGPDGAFGIGDIEFIPLYASVEGWIESLALENEVRSVANEIRKLRGPEVSSLDFSAMLPFPGIPGLSESWLMDDGQIVFVSRGISLISGHLDDVVAIVYSGIPDREASLGLWSS
ncbi:hypothetical protein E1193_21485 [Micromonospora sp. KC606]|uniref:hypothetical protein n=1 Tax=Micromonospora sp. KC606 TaxID=2530379 RepID=UPI00104FC5EC|nr:hypothetical protein [Micromonospora sp. KC606]TDC77963.1 hypothetical protein E1193_21485 [Micromonospora sp. KC606]